MRGALLAGLVALALPLQAQADDFPDAMRQLRALQSVADTGVTVDEYQRRVLDAKIVIDRYLATRDTAPRRAAVAHAIEQYVQAASSWRYSITGSGPPTGGSGCPPAAEAIAQAREIEREQYQRLAEKIDRSPAKDTEAIGLQLRTLSAAAEERAAIGRAAREVYRHFVPLYWACASTWAGTAETGRQPVWPRLPPPASKAAAQQSMTPAELDAQTKRAQEQTGAAKCTTKTYGGGAAVTVCE